MAVDHLKFSPEILKRLGEELTPHPDQGVLELVRNSYDADAVHCSISLDKVDHPGGTVTIIDDGSGMDEDDIKNGWLLIGKSGKAAERRTKLGRLIVGNKGLGRLAALRTGTAVTLQTRPRENPEIEYSLVLDWQKYETAKTVEEISLTIQSSHPTLSAPGTRIVIHDLSKPFSSDDVRRLARSLLLLSDPFDGKTGFRPVLNAPAFKELEKLVKEKYFLEADFHLIAHLDKSGNASAEVFLPSGRKKWTAQHNDIASRKEATYRCPEATFELWIFLLKGSSFSSKNAKIGDVRKWLTEYGGVHLYHRGLRVYPYGDPGHDWLDMNLARTRSPEERPSTNNSIGRVIVEDVGEILVQKTDRTGFVESEQFFELRRFAQETLEWLADVRLKESEKRRERERQTSHKIFKEARSNLSQAIKTAPVKARPALQKAFRTYESAREREAKTLRAELQLYRTLSTVGTTYAVFAHELAGPGRRIRQLAESIARRAQKQLGEEQYMLNLQDPVSSIVRTADNLTLFPKLALQILEREKRKQGRVRVHDAIHEVIKLVHPFVGMYKATIDLDLSEQQPEVFGSIASIESILMNLITNALNAFVSAAGSGRERKIEIRTEMQGEQWLLISVLDTGPGILTLSTEEIWLPGRTTSPDGTGLGLTIVRDSVVDLGGKVSVVAQGTLGGAEFLIRLPLADASEN
jgi:signal transduction histidine kinase